MGPLSRLFLPSHTALCIKSFLSSPKKTDSVLHGDERNDLMHRDRKSTRLNSSHGYISYAVFCLKKKNILTILLASPLPVICSAIGPRGARCKTRLPHFTMTIHVPTTRRATEFTAGTPRSRWGAG